MTQPRSKKEEILQKSSKCSVRLSKGFDGTDLLSGKETKYAPVETSIFAAVLIDKASFNHWPRPSTVLVCPMSCSAYLSQSGRQCCLYQKKEKSRQEFKLKDVICHNKKTINFFPLTFPKNVKAVLSPNKKDK